MRTNSNPSGVSKAWRVAAGLLLAVLASLAVGGAEAHTLDEKLTAHPYQAPIYAAALLSVAAYLIHLDRRGVSVRGLLKTAGSAIRAHIPVFASAFLGMAALYTATTALNWYAYIPDWVPYGVALWTPQDPWFDVYALTWRLDDHWQINYNEIHGAYFLALSTSFALTMALFAEHRARGQACCALPNGGAGARIGGSPPAALFGRLRTTWGVGAGTAMSLLAAFSCCLPAFALFLIPSLFLSLSPLEDSLGSLGVALLLLNAIYLAAGVHRGDNPTASASARVRGTATEG